MPYWGRKGRLSMAKHSNRDDDRFTIQFNTHRWRDDPGLRLCSLAARGLWLELLIIMFLGEKRGYLSLSGKQMSSRELASLVADSPARIERLLAELEGRKVFSRDENGVIYCRRMVQDIEKSKQKAEAGRLGGLAKAKQNLGN